MKRYKLLSPEEEAISAVGMMGDAEPNPSLQVYASSPGRSSIDPIL